jgi:hypothetical protein
MGNIARRNPRSRLGLSQGPVFTEEDLALDVGAEIRRLVKQLSGLDAQEARDQVYRRLLFHLCTPCYERWINDPCP